MQLGEASEPPLIEAVARGISLVTPANLGYANAGSPVAPLLMVMKSSHITSLSQLTGKTIGVEASGANFDIAVHYAFLKDGITGANLPHFVQAAPTALVPQLVAGQVAAIEIGTPFVSEAEAEGAVSLLDPFTVKQGLQGRQFLIAKTSYVNANLAAMARLRTALQEADKFIADNPAQAKLIIQKSAGLPSAVMKNYALPIYATTPSASELSMWVTLMEATGYLAKNANVSVASMVEG